MKVDWDEESDLLQDRLEAASSFFLCGSVFVSYMDALTNNGSASSKPNLFRGITNVDIAATMIWLGVAQKGASDVALRSTFNGDDTLTISGGDTGAREDRLKIRRSVTGGTVVHIDLTQSSTAGRISGAVSVMPRLLARLAFPSPIKILEAGFSGLVADSGTGNTVLDLTTPAGTTSVTAAGASGAVDGRSDIRSNLDIDEYLDVKINEVTDGLQQLHWWVRCCPAVIP